MNKVFRAVAIAATTLVAGATVQLTTPGTAVADYRDCPDHYVCLWGDGNYAGRYVFYPDNNLSVPNVGDRMNDLTTSIWNRTGRTICFYNDSNFQGQLLCVGAGGSTANVGAGANDRITSFQAF
jgi:hypothetical protein